MSNAETAAGGGRIKAVQDWLSGRADTRLGRLRAAVVSKLLRGEPQLWLCRNRVLVALGLAGGPRDSLVLPLVREQIPTRSPDRLVTHLKLTERLPTSLRDTFGSASSNALAATITVVISFLLWGLEHRPDLPRRLRPRLADKGRIRADQGLLRSSSSSSSPARSLWQSSRPRNSAISGWFVLLPLWLIGSTVFWLWVPRSSSPKDRPPRSTARRAAGLRRPRRRNRHPPFYLAAPLNANGEAFGSFGSCSR